MTSAPMTPSQRGGLSSMPRFQRLGLLMARRRWWVIGTWAIVLLAALPFAPRAGSALRAGGFTLPDLPSEEARATLAQLGVPPSVLAIVIQSTGSARAGDPAFETAAAAAVADVTHAAHVTGIQSHLLAPRQVSADGTVVYDIVDLDLSPDDSPQAMTPVQEALHDEPGIRTLIGGAPAFYGDIQTASEEDLRRAELVSLPLAAIALVLIFGGIVAAGVPLVVGGSAVLLALAAIFLLASATPMSIFVLNLATLLGLGLGVDYSLLLTSRFREELGRRGGGWLVDGSLDRAAVDEAVGVTVATAGRAIFFSGFTVLLGLIGLVLFDFMILRSVGVGGAIVVGMAVLAALTLLPAVLAVLGPRLGALSVRSLLRRPPPDPAAPVAESRWARLARWVMQRPWRVFVPTLGILVLLGVPFLHVQFDAPDETILPANLQSRQAYDVLATTFGEGTFAPLELAVRATGPITDPTVLGKLYDYSRELASDPRVVRVDGLVDLDPRLTRAQYQLLYAAPGGPPDRFAAAALAATTKGDLTVFTVTTPYGPNAAPGRDLVAALRDPASALAPPAGLTVQVAGGAAEVTDVVARMGQDFPRTALFILITTYLVLFLLLRSVVLPLKALVMNSLSIIASFGALVWIFQDGNLSALIGFQPLGYVETTQPVILFCVLFGLSMDYEVFLLSRMKEAYDAGADNRTAVARGLERSGRIVTSAALIVVIVAGSFVFSQVVLIKALGLGMAIAVALDATVVRALLVPATMRLLGHWNWWMPARLARWIAARLPVVEGATLVQAVVVAILAAFVLGACSANGALLANAPAAHPQVPRPSATPATAPDPQPLAFPRDDGPHDRLTEWWYYTGHLRTATGATYRIRGRHLPRRTGRLPGDLGLPHRRHRRAGPSLAVRPALGGGAAGGRGAGRVERPLRLLPGHLRDARCARSRARRSLGDAWLPGPRPARGGLFDGRLRLPADAGRRRAAAGPARHDRVRAVRCGRRVVLLLASDDAGGRDPDHRRPGRGRHGGGVVRPPVGRLRDRRRGRMGLVRGQPARRLGRHPVAHPRRRWDVPARLWHVRHERRDGGPPGDRRLHGQRDRPLDQPSHRRGVPSWLAGRDTEGGPRHHAPAHGSRPGAGHARDHGRRLLGGVAGGDRSPRRLAGRRPGLRGADGLRR